MKKEEIEERVSKLSSELGLIYTAEEEYIGIVIPITQKEKKFYYVDGNYSRCFREIEGWIEEKKEDIILNNLIIIKKRLGI